MPSRSPHLLCGRWGEQLRGVMLRLRRSMHDCSLALAKGSASWPNVDERMVDRTI